MRTPFGPRAQVCAALAAGTLLGLAAAGLPHAQAKPVGSPTDAALFAKVARLQGQLNFLAIHVAALETRLRPADGRPTPFYEQRPYALIPGPHITPDVARPVPGPSAP